MKQHLKRQIYGNVTWRDRIMERIDVMETSDINKTLLKNFGNYLYSTGSGRSRVSKVLGEWRKLILVTHFAGDLDKITKQDAINLVTYINLSEMWEKNTKRDYRRCIKQFYRWFKDEDVRLQSKDENEKFQATKFYNYIEKEVKRGDVTPDIDPTTILRDEEVEKVVKYGCRTIKEMTFIKFLHETGIRTGELLGLRIRDIELKKNIGIAHVDGKTGRRSVWFTRSMGYMARWLESHPFRNDPECYLWLTENNRNLHEPYNYKCAVDLVTRCFNRANDSIPADEDKITKRHNLHWFRHSRATLNAPHWTEQIMCKYFGWVAGSKQVRTYVHLCTQQVEDAFLKMNGLATEEDAKKNLPQVCGCGMSNDSFARYCLQCGNPLSVVSAVQDQVLAKSENEKTLDWMMELMKDPVMLEKFKKFKESMDGVMENDF
jgi:integrase/recombinase XerD